MTSQIRIQELEQMAKLDLSDVERAEALQYLEFLTEDFDRLSQIETAGIAPLIHGIELTNIFREDRVNKTISRDTLLANAPEQSDGYFQVPKTLE